MQVVRAKSIFVVTYKSHDMKKMIFANVFLFHDRPRISLLSVGLENNHIYTERYEIVGKKNFKKTILSYIRRQNELVRQVRAEFHNELLNVFLLSFLFSFVCLPFSFLNDDGDLRPKKKEISFSFDSPNRCGLCRA